MVTIFTFIGMWGNFFVPFMLLLSPETTAGVGQHLHLLRPVRPRSIYGQLAAYSLLYSMPVVLLYLVLSRRLGGAFALGGGVKG